MKSVHEIERDHQEAHEAAIEQGDLETIFGHALPHCEGEHLKYFMPAYEKDIRQTVQHALDQRGIMGLSEQVVGSHLKMLAEIIMRLRLVLASREYGLRGLDQGRVSPPNAETMQFWELLDRTTQAYMKVLRDFSAARHALTLGQGPQKGKDPEGAAARSAPAQPGPPEPPPAQEP
jgi:hypothetical protein